MTGNGDADDGVRDSLGPGAVRSGRRPDPSGVNAPDARPMRTRKPRVTAFVALISGALLVAVGALLLWRGAVDGALVGPGASFVTVGLLSGLLGALGLRIATAAGAATTTARATALVSLLIVAAGMAGAALGIGVGAVQGSIAAIGAGALTFLASVMVALQGALLYGAARHRAVTAERR